MFFWQRIILKTPVLSKLAPFLGIKGEIISIGDSDLWIDHFGKKEDPALLLLMGGGCQGIIWTEKFCHQLAKAGFFVIRFDQRDTGLSSYTSKPYTFLEMAKDVTSLLDRLKIKKTHMMGISMGGAIAQVIAHHSPSYVNSLILLATSNNFYPIAAAMQGNLDHGFGLSPPELSWFKWVKEVEALPAFAFRRRLKKHMEGWKLLNGKTPFPQKFYNKILTDSIKRQRSYKALLNHRTALLASLEILQNTEGKIQQPTLVIHGDCDPLFPKDHAIHVASTIPSSKLVMIEDMGHNFCPCFQEKVAEEVIHFLKNER